MAAFVLCLLVSVLICAAADGSDGLSKAGIEYEGGAQDAFAFSPADSRKGKIDDLSSKVLATAAAAALKAPVVQRTLHVLGVLQNLAGDAPAASPVQGTVQPQLRGSQASPPSAPMSLVGASVGTRVQDVGASVGTRAQESISATTAAEFLAKNLAVNQQAVMEAEELEGRAKEIRGQAAQGRKLAEQAGVAAGSQAAHETAKQLMGELNKLHGDSMSAFVQAAQYRARASSELSAAQNLLSGMEHALEPERPTVATTATWPAAPEVTSEEAEPHRGRTEEQADSQSQLWLHNGIMPAPVQPLPSFPINLAATNPVLSSPDPGVWAPIVLFSTPFSSGAGVSATRHVRAR